MPDTHPRALRKLLVASQGLVRQIWSLVVSPAATTAERLSGGGDDLICGGGDIPYGDRAMATGAGLTPRGCHRGYAMRALTLIASLVEILNRTTSDSS